MITKIKDYLAEQNLCAHPEHEIPSHMVFEPGEYEHECPGCGKRKRFVVPLIRF